ncbi:MAG TPA: DUF3467 domain-containing protein [Acidobacteriaceae bacterium]|jgi:hypothetical protein|nr:DUF3467 domain-containing protein [Acidobacteriaceae bacterium]
MDDDVPYSFGEEQEGRYANHFQIGHNAFEVVLQFGQFYEEEKRVVMHTRIVTCPAYAETLLRLLSHSLAQYESSYGSISTGRPHE